MHVIIAVNGQSDGFWASPNAYFPFCIFRDHTTRPFRDAPPTHCCSQSMQSGSLLQGAQTRQAPEWPGSPWRETLAEILDPWRLRQSPLGRPGIDQRSGVGTRRVLFGIVGSKDIRNHEVLAERDQLSAEVPQGEADAPGRESRETWELAEYRRSWPCRDSQEVSVFDMAPLSRCDCGLEDSVPERGAHPRVPPPLRRLTSRRPPMCAGS